MGIEIARHAGFCMGVRRAVDRTLEAAESGGEIVTFGEVVHNPQVIEKLEAMGVYAIHSCEQAAGKTVIIRSHGVSPDITRQLEQTARQVIDLTCPFVARLHDVVSRYSADGSPVILIGQSDHPEVVGTIGCVCGPCYTICTPEEAQQLPPLKRALAVSQTTFPHERWEAILPVLRERVEDLTVQDTICTATVLRQTEARRLAASVDALLDQRQHPQAVRNVQVHLRAHPTGRARGGYPAGLCKYPFGIHWNHRRRQHAGLGT